MLLIFDCDGVVIDSMVLHTTVEAEMFAAHGIVRTPEQLARQFGGVGVSGMMAALEAESGVSFPTDFIQKLERRKEDVFPGQLRPMPYFDTILSMIDDASRCIASGSALSRIEFCLDITGQRTAFAPHIYSSDMVAHGKPAPDLFLYAAQQMGFAPQDCIVIEDAVAGVQAGKAAGMKVFGYIGGSHCGIGYGDSLHAAGADLIFDDMRQLPVHAGLADRS